MKVKLISYTKAHNEEKFGKNLVELIAYVARVSNPSNQHNKETSEKLIEYLIKHKHWSPLEMVDVTLEIESTRDIIRQILRHRSFVFQEFSQRYADPTDMDAGLGFSFRDARLQDDKNRQNSLEVDDEELKEWWWQQQDDITMSALTVYEDAISRGIAKEQARAVLPEGLTKSRIYMKGSIRSWIHYIMIRSGVETQKEHREIALACADNISLVFPMIGDFINEYI